MNKKWQNIKYWIFNLFTFSKPIILGLEYVDIVIDQKAIFLISWEIKKAYKFDVSELKFRSFKKHASAYLSVPIEINEVTIKVSNSWRCQIKKIKLLRTELKDQIDFNITPHFETFNKNSVLIPAIKLNKKQLKLNALKIANVKIKTPEIINLNYSQIKS